MSELAEDLADLEIEGTEKNSETAQYVTFLVGDKTFGIVIVMVREIKQWTPTTSLPNQKPHMRGVLNLRGTIVPVHDLRASFGGPLTDATENHVVVIASIQDQTIGILVDAVSDIVTVASEDIRPIPTTGGTVGDSSISGLVNNGDEMVALLNLEAMFLSEETTEEFGAT